jgi:glycosyltransferase involved in cell wall biosynthesis
MTPFISVCIPTYNRSSFLETAIRSVILQTLTDYEIIVIDDNSTDDTESKISEFQNKRIYYIKNPKNLGAVMNFNRCIDLARGEYISILHSDDYFEPRFLEMESAELNRSPHVGMVYSAYYVLHELTNRTKMIIPHKDSQIFDPREQFESLVTRGNYIAFSGVMVRRSCFKSVGDFNTALPHCADFEMWLRICLRHSIGYLNTPLVTYRFHGGMDSFAFFSSSEGIDQEWQAIESALSHSSWPDEERQDYLQSALRRLATRNLRHAFFHADKGMAIVRKHLDKIVRFSPQIRFHPLYCLIRLFTLTGDGLFTLLNKVRVWVLNRMSQ